MKHSARMSRELLCTRGILAPLRISLFSIMFFLMGANLPFVKTPALLQKKQVKSSSVSSSSQTTAPLSIPGRPVSTGPIFDLKDHGALRISITGVINPVRADFFSRAVKRTESQSRTLLLVEMDTPGGLMKSMRQITQSIMNSSVPVIVYVSPQGARAASAGAFILGAAHVAVMAPGTNVGAAHPVSVGMGSSKQGDKSEVMTEKVTNDAVASFRSLLDQRGRNIDWARRAVRLSESITARQALEQDVIDMVAVDRQECLKRSAGLVVVVSGGKRVRLPKLSVEPIEFKMSWSEKLLAQIADPSIAYMLMMLGALAIVYEVTNPGIGLPGVVGVISLAFAFWALQVFPLSATGVILLLFGAIFLFLETQIPSAGVLTIGGVTCLVVGSFMLIDSPMPSLRIPWKTIASVTGTITAFFVFVIGRAVSDQFRPVVTGIEAMLGSRGHVKKTVSVKTGLIRIHGEIWKARCNAPDSIEQGLEVEVYKVDGLTVWVHSISDEAKTVEGKDG